MNNETVQIEGNTVTLTKTTQTTKTLAEYIASINNEITALTRTKQSLDNQKINCDTRIAYLQQKLAEAQPTE